MKKAIFITILIIIFSVSATGLFAQCSVCSKTAMQLGEKPARGLNQGILYLMFIPFGIVGFIGYRWWRGQIAMEKEEEMRK